MGCLINVSSVVKCLGIVVLRLIFLHTVHMHMQFMKSILISVQNLFDALNPMNGDMQYLQENLQYFLNT